MATPHNPSLREEPRDQPIKTAPPILRQSLLSWLESIGRFHQSNEIDEFQDYKIPDELDDILETENYVSENEEE
jgi:hypothetical protein